jgi:hypothetical protein
MGIIPLDQITLQAYQAMHPKWIPYWEASPVVEEEATTTAATSNQQLQYEQEVHRIQSHLETLVGNNSNTSTASTSKDGEKEDKIAQEARLEFAYRLQQQADRLKLEGYREYLYFWINWIAFYGYLLGIVCYYTDESISTESIHLRWMKFGLSHADADWHGNFAGDLMWTIEPIIILTSPWLIERIVTTQKPLFTAGKKSSTTITTTTTKSKSE